LYLPIPHSIAAQVIIVWMNSLFDRTFFPAQDR